MTESVQKCITLSAKQRKAISSVITCNSISEACKSIGISRSVFYGWMKDEAFRDALMQEQNSVIETALKDLKGLSSEAVEQLGKLLRETGNETVRLKAISLILEHTIKLKEIEDIERRLEEIERRLSNV